MCLGGGRVVAACPGTCVVHFTTPLLFPASVYPGHCPCVWLLPIHGLQLVLAFLHVCTAGSARSVLLALPVYGSSRALAHASSQTILMCHLCSALPGAPLRMLSDLLSVCVFCIWQGAVYDVAAAAVSLRPLPVPSLDVRHQVVLFVTA